MSERAIRATLIAELEALNGGERKLVLRLEEIAASVRQDKLKKTLLTQRDIAQKRVERMRKVFKSIDAEPQEAEAHALDAILERPEGMGALTTDLSAATAVLQAVQAVPGRQLVVHPLEREGRHLPVPGL